MDTHSIVTMSQLHMYGSGIAKGTLGLLVYLLIGMKKEVFGGDPEVGGVGEGALGCSRGSRGEVS